MAHLWTLAIWPGFAGQARGEVAAVAGLPVVRPRRADGRGKDPVGNGSDGAQVKNCRHGTFDAETQACHCNDRWATAGITDTLDFLEGVCEQFHCKSDEDCQKVLGISDATCPVPNWNCYCNFKFAFYNGGHGFENDKGECMGIMYAFSVWGTQGSWWLICNAWRGFLIAALVALPVGRKRSICDHQWPSIWNTLRRCCGCNPNCTGACVLQSGYTLDMFKDDIAWSVYILDVGVWCYLFIITVYLVALCIWSVVLWAIVFVMLVAMAVAGLCLACSEGGCAGLDCCACDVAACSSCGDCAPFALHGGIAAGSSPGDAVYFSGEFPYDPWWGYSGYGNLGVTSHDDCCCCSKDTCFCCKPFAWLAFVFPVVPENAWGGALGLLMGTHHLTPTCWLYQGGNCFVEFLRMGWRRNTDLHSSNSWRGTVHNFLAGGDRQVQPELRRTFTQNQRNEEHQNVVFIGRARAVKVHRVFSRTADDCVTSSYDDYQGNTCWICQQSNPDWDLWLSCRHLFCKECSTQMLQRRMPCPLCRVASSTVLRGYAYGRGNEASESEADLSPAASRSVQAT